MPRSSSTRGQQRPDARLHPALRRAAAFSLSAIALSCSSPPPPADAGCPDDLPQACPSPAPAYADVAPVFAAHCTKCHGPDGVEATRPLDSYAHIVKLKSPVLNQIYACVMPPSPEPALSSSERKLVLSWLVCGAPQ